MLRYAGVTLFRVLQDIFKATMCATSVSLSFDADADDDDDGEFEGGGGLILKNIHYSGSEKAKPLA